MLGSHEWLASEPVTAAVGIDAASVAAEGSDGGPPAARIPPPTEDPAGALARLVTAGRVGREQPGTERASELVPVALTQRLPLLLHSNHHLTEEGGHAVGVGRAEDAEQLVALRSVQLDPECKRTGERLHHLGPERQLERLGYSLLQRRLGWRGAVDEQEARRLIQHCLPGREGTRGNELVAEDGGARMPLTVATRDTRHLGEHCRVTHGAARSGGDGDDTD